MLELQPAASVKPEPASMASRPAQAEEPEVISLLSDSDDEAGAPALHTPPCKKPRLVTSLLDSESERIPAVRSTPGGPGPASCQQPGKRGGTDGGASRPAAASVQQAAGGSAASSAFQSREHTQAHINTQQLAEQPPSAATAPPAEELVFVLDGRLARANGVREYRVPLASFGLTAAGQSYSGSAQQFLDVVWRTVAAGVGVDGPKLLTSTGTLLTDDWLRANKLQDQQTFYMSAASDLAGARFPSSVDITPSTRAITERLPHDYTDTAALLELLDNALEAVFAGTPAGARQIGLWLCHNAQQEPCIIVRDNGCGMDQLRNWGQLGSSQRSSTYSGSEPAPYLTAQLGRFGVGGLAGAMKLARRVHVKSMTTGSDMLHEMTIDADELLKLHLAPGSASCLTPEQRLREAGQQQGFTEITLTHLRSNVMTAAGHFHSGLQIEEVKGMLRNVYHAYLVPGGHGNSLAPAVDLKLHPMLDGPGISLAQEIVSDPEGDLASLRQQIAHDKCFTQTFTITARRQHGAGFRAGKGRITARYFPAKNGQETFEHVLAKVEGQTFDSAPRVEFVFQGRGLLYAADELCTAYNMRKWGGALRFMEPKKAGTEDEAGCSGNPRSPGTPVGQPRSRPRQQDQAPAGQLASARGGARSAPRAQVPERAAKRVHVTVEVDGGFSPNTQKTSLNRDDILTAALMHLGYDPRKNQAWRRGWDVDVNFNRQPNGLQFRSRYHDWLADCHTRLDDELKPLGDGVLVTSLGGTKDDGTPFTAATIREQLWVDPNDMFAMLCVYSGIRAGPHKWTAGDRMKLTCGERTDLLEDTHTTRQRNAPEFAQIDCFYQKQSDHAGEGEVYVVYRPMYRPHVDVQACRVDASERSFMLGRYCIARTASELYKAQPVSKPEWDAEVANRQRQEEQARMRQPDRLALQKEALKLPVLESGRYALTVGSVLPASVPIVVLDRNSEVFTTSVQVHCRLLGPGGDEIASIPALTQANKGQWNAIFTFQKFRADTAGTYKLEFTASAGSGSAASEGEDADITGLLLELHAAVAADAQPAALRACCHEGPCRQQCLLAACRASRKPAPQLQLGAPWPEGRDKLWITQHDDTTAGNLILFGNNGDLPSVRFLLQRLDGTRLDTLQVEDTCHIEVTQDRKSLQVTIPPIRGQLQTAGKEPALLVPYFADSSGQSLVVCYDEYRIPVQLLPGCAESAEVISVYGSDGELTVVQQDGSPGTLQLAEHVAPHAVLELTIQLRDASGNKTASVSSGQATAAAPKVRLACTGADVTGGKQRSKKPDAEGCINYTIQVGPAYGATATLRLEYPINRELLRLVLPVEHVTLRLFRQLPDGGRSALRPDQPVECTSGAAVAGLGVELLDHQGQLVHGGDWRVHIAGDKQQLPFEEGSCMLQMCAPPGTIGQVSRVVQLAGHKEVTAQLLLDVRQPLPHSVSLSSRSQLEAACGKPFKLPFQVVSVCGTELLLRAEQADQLHLAVLASPAQAVLSNFAYNAAAAAFTAAMMGPTGEYSVGLFDHTAHPLFPACQPSGSSPSTVSVPMEVASEPAAEKEQQPLLVWSVRLGHGMPAHLGMDDAVARQGLTIRRGASACLRLHVHDAQGNACTSITGAPVVAKVPDAASTARRSKGATVVPGLSGTARMAKGVCDFPFIDVRAPQGSYVVRLTCRAGSTTLTADVTVNVTAGSLPATLRILPEEECQLTDESYTFVEQPERIVVQTPAAGVPVLPPLVVVAQAEDGGKCCPPLAGITLALRGSPGAAHPTLPGPMTARMATEQQSDASLPYDVYRPGRMAFAAGAAAGSYTLVAATHGAGGLATEREVIVLPAAPQRLRFLPGYGVKSLSRIGSALAEHESGELRVAAYDHFGNRIHDMPADVTLSLVPVSMDPAAGTMPALTSSQGGNQLDQPMSASPQQLAATFVDGVATFQGVLAKGAVGGRFELLLSAALPPHDSSQEDLVHITNDPQAAHGSRPQVVLCNSEDDARQRQAVAAAQQAIVQQELRLASAAQAAAMARSSAAECAAALASLDAQLATEQSTAPAGGYAGLAGGAAADLRQRDEQLQAEQAAHTGHPRGWRAHAGELLAQEEDAVATLRIIARAQAEGVPEYDPESGVVVGPLAQLVQVESPALRDVLCSLLAGTLGIVICCTAQGLELLTSESAHNSVRTLGSRYAMPCCTQLSALILEGNAYLERLEHRCLAQLPSGCQPQGEQETLPLKPPPGEANDGTGWLGHAVNMVHLPAGLARLRRTLLWLHLGRVLLYDSNAAAKAAWRRLAGSCSVHDYTVASLQGHIYRPDGSVTLAPSSSVASWPIGLALVPGSDVLEGRVPSLFPPYARANKRLQVAQQAAARIAQLQAATEEHRAARASHLEHQGLAEAQVQAAQAALGRAQAERDAAEQGQPAQHADLAEDDAAGDAQPSTVHLSNGSGAPGAQHAAQTPPPGLRLALSALQESSMDEQALSGSSELRDSMAARYGMMASGRRHARKPAHPVARRRPAGASGGATAVGCGGQGADAAHDASAADCAQDSMDSLQEAGGASPSARLGAVATGAACAGSPTASVADGAAGGGVPYVPARLNPLRGSGRAPRLVQSDSD